jgi:hypothetical protein
MRHSRFTDEQIIGILKEQENGLRTAEVCRKQSASQLIGLISGGREEVAALCGIEKVTDLAEGLA